MNLVELKELKDQLKDFLAKGFIRVLSGMGCSDGACTKEVWLSSYMH